MRPGRAAVHTALPVLALAALGALTALRPGTAPAATVASQGSGSFAAAPAPLVPASVSRIITDGSPQLISLPVRPRSLAAQRVPTRVVTRHVTVRRQAAPAVRPAAPVAPPPAVQAPKASDTYPYAADSGDGSDAWGFTKRQCVSYVAWRLADAGRPIDNATQGWGSALDWDEAATRLGFRVSTQPAVGTVAQWDADERSRYWSPGASSADGWFVSGSAGHVGWVTKVYSDGSVQVAQYNGNGDRTYSTMRVKAPRYLSL